MSSPYLKIGFACALFATLIGLAISNLTPTEPVSEYRYDGLSQPVPPPPPPPAPVAPPPPSAPPTVGEEEVYEVVGKMPLFPGCDDVIDFEERKGCANKRLLEYVYKNISYPLEASQKGIEGTALISFKVSYTGEVFDEKIMRNPGAGTGGEALRVVRTMNENSIRWTPGRTSGRPVTVQFNLPVKFKLE